MKRSWKTTEYLFPVIFCVAVLLKFSHGQITAFEVSVLLAVVLNPFVVSRVMAKVSRGLSVRGIGEIQAVLYQVGWNVYASENALIPTFEAYLFMAGAIAIYVLARGRTKKMAENHTIAVVH